MAGEATSDRASWIRVTVRLKVPASIARADVLPRIERDSLQFRATAARAPASSFRSRHRLRTVVPEPASFDALRAFRLL